MINEFGEEITNDEINEIIDKVMHFSTEQIDEFFFLCGFLDNNRGDNKAIPDWRITDIKHKKRAAYQQVSIVLEGTPFKEVIAFLARVEQMIT